MSWGLWGLHTASDHPTDEWGNRAYPKDKYGNPDYGDDYDLEELMYGQCAAYAVAHQREHPHLRFGIDWEDVDHTHHEWGDFMADEGIEEDEHPDQVFRRPQHIFTHDDHWAYDASGARPLGKMKRWDDVTLNHTKEEVEGTGYLESGYEPDADYVRKNPPRPPPTHIVEADVADDLMRLAMGWRGDAPQDLTFKHVHNPNGVDYMGQDVLTAHTSDGEEVGQLYWFPSGEISWISVRGDHTGRDIGRAMVDHAITHHNPNIHHSTELTPSGRRWMEQNPIGQTTAARLATHQDHRHAGDFCAHPSCRPDLPREMYHGTSANWRPGVAQHGLLTENSQDDLCPAIYMSPSPERPPYEDVWAIDTSKLNHLEDDSYYMHEFQDIGGSYCTEEDIPPSAMRLHRPATHRLDKDYNVVPLDPHTASRLAMPAPLPQGIHFKPFDRGDEISQQIGWKHPNVSHQIGPGVAAYLPGNHVPVGHIEWLDDRDADVAEQFGEPPINPGEVSYINVDDPLRRQSIGTALFDHAQAHEPRVHHSDDRTELGKRWVNHEQSRNSVTAAVTQDLVSRLHDEFHDWWDKNGEEPDDIFGEGGEDEDGYGGDPNAYATRGPIGHWPNIENFLKERYPAAHKDLGAGLEEAASGLDGRWVGDEYETGPEAEARHGYDPKEVAASMLLLHNDSHPLRGHLADEDQARLNDIAQKRYQMQRTYEQRQTTAGLHGDLPENITFQHHSDDTPPFPDVIDPRMTVWASDSGTVSAHDGDKMIGYMRWRTDNHPRRKGEIKEIRVHPDYQRRGVGTAMFDWVTDKIDPDLKHSNNLSDEGRAFADAEDARPLAQERYEAWRNGQPMPKRFAMPMRDAYDWMISDSKRIDDNIPERGTFYHGTDHEHQPGDILTSVRSRHEQDPEANQERMDYYTKSIGAPNHADWVWMYNHPAPATKYMKHVYEVEPLDEGPWIWNNMFGDDGVARPPESDQDFPRLVSPRVRVVRKLSPDEHAAANTHLRDHYRALHSKTSAFRLAMAWDTWAPHINGGCKGICAPGDMTMGEYSIDHTDGSGPQPSDLMPGIKGRSLLQFTHDTDQHGNPEIYVSGIHVDEGHRRDGIAEALMRRMRQDHPDTPINPGFTTDDGQGLLDGLKKRIPGAGDALVPRHAAVNRKLVNRLYSEFHDWWGTNKDDLYFTERNNGGMGPLGHWPNIEAFLADHYPAAHRNLDMGMEAAQPLMDGKGLYGDRVPDAPTYETGQAAVDLHGYDPKEIAASMLLLHNGVNPQRGDMAQHDQDRLNDIFDKRVKMQRTHEQRRPTAGRNGDPPPMTFEPFNTMWSNGIMARHAEDGRPIAHLHWHPDGEIETIRVHPELQGRDIAKHVLAHAVTHPETFEARQGIKPSNNLTNAGRAFARSLGHDPSDEEIDPADDDVTNWGWTAVDNYTPMHIPYTGQNEDEMSHHLDKPWTPPERTAATHGDDWPVWWRGRTHPDVPWDKRWHPNHPQHVPGPWDQ